MNLGRKFIIWVMVILLVTSSLSAFLHYRLWMHEIREDLVLRGSAIGHIIESAIVNLMLVSKERELINKTIMEFSESDEIGSIRLSDSEGTVRWAFPPEHMGSKIRSLKAQGDMSDREELQKVGDVFRWTHVINNRQECYGCHSPENERLGTIEIDFEALGRDRSAHIVNVVVVMLSSFVIIGVALKMLFDNMIIKRLNGLVQKISKVKEGDYESYIDSEGNDEITGFVESINDMTTAIRSRDEDRETLFRLIEKSKQEWQATFDSITDMIHIHDGEHRILRANRAFAEYYGYEPREIISRTCKEISNESELFSAGCAYDEADSEEGFRSIEVFDPRTQRMFRLLMYPYFSPQGKFVGSVSIARDITEEREREMKLIMSERLASLGQMASGIAHEINNPLASIAGCAEGLLKRLQGGKIDEKVFTNYLGIIEEEVTRCKRITTGMLSFVGSTEYEMKPVDLKGLINRTVEIVALQGRMDSVDIIDELNDDLPKVNGSEEELKQVIMTIVVNALDSMDDKGSIKFSANESSGHIDLFISDSGRGISPDDKARIFSPFFTTKASSGGIGLGLAIARKIILDHDGEIEVRQDLGEGATFKIRLPKAGV